MSEFRIVKPEVVPEALIEAVEDKIWQLGADSQAQYERQLVLDGIKESFDDRRATDQPTEADACTAEVIDRTTTYLAITLGQIDVARQLGQSGVDIEIPFFGHEQAVVTRSLAVTAEIISRKGYKTSVEEGTYRLDMDDVNFGRPANYARLKFKL